MIRKARLAQGALLAALALGILAGCVAPLSNVDVSDPVITARIKARLRERTDLNIAFVDVNTHQREVTLSGVVGSVEEKEEVVRVVRRTPGVRRVIANILIQQ